MKKSFVFILIVVSALVCVWLLWKSAQPTLNEAALPAPPAAAAPQTVPIMPADTAGSSSGDTKPGAGDSSPLNQAWIEARSASIIISQAPDPVTREPNGVIKLASGATVALGETPPFYRIQLKTAKHPILLGDKDTRHHFVRSVTVIRIEEGWVEREAAVSISIPWATASPGGFLFKRDENEISRIGIIIPDVKVPEGDDPTSAQWSVYIRIRNREISTEELAQATYQPLGADTVLVMPTQPDSPPSAARVLWLALDANGSFAVTRNK